MKVILLIIAVIAFTSASAQYSIDTFLVKPDQFKPKTSPSELPKIYMTDPSQPLIANSKLLHTLPNGNKVYALPQDNMPCVVPDMSQYNNSMGLLKPDMPQYNIPNPSYPPQNKIERFTPEKLKEFQELLNKRSKNNN